MRITAAALLPASAGQIFGTIWKPIQKSNSKRDILRSLDIVTKASPCLTSSIYLILKTVSDVLWESHPGTRAQAGE